MITLTIPITDLILSATDDTDLLELPEAEAILRITTAYTFLPPPLSVVIEDDVVEISLAADYQPTPKITRLYEHATTAATVANMPGPSSSTANTSPKSPRPLTPGATWGWPTWNWAR